MISGMERHGQARASGPIQRAGWTPAALEALRPLALRYVWWASPDESLQRPERVVAQVMNLGDHRDVEALADLLGEQALREVLAHAEAGQFSERAWTYWHYRLGLAALEQVPPLPRRSFGG
jgi:hypothetical protein